MTSNDVAAHLSSSKYSVEHGMTPKQTIEKMSSTQQFSSVNRQVSINGIEDFQRNGKKVALKRPTYGAELKDSPDRALRYQGRPAMFVKF